MGEKSPTVSVIIPTYNRAHLIGRSIASVLNQTYQDFEIIVIDDGSSDNTEQLILNFGNEKIRYIRHEKNKGQPAARNAGIKAARGNYIAFHDSDDECLPEKLEKVMKVFETAPPSIGVVYSGFYKITGDNITYMPTSWVTEKEGNIHQQLLRGSCVWAGNMITRKECLEKVGMFDESLPALEDWELTIRISKHYEFKFIEEPLIIVYYTLDSVTANQDAYINAFKIIIEKHYQEFINDMTLLANHHYGIGYLLCQGGRLKEGRDFYIKSLKLRPVNLILLLELMLSYFGKDIYNQVWKTYRKIKKPLKSSGKLLAS